MIEARLIEANPIDSIQSAHQETLLYTFMAPLNLTLLVQSIVK